MGLYCDWKKFLKERQRKLNKEFVWTPEHIQAFEGLNDGLLLKYKEAYHELSCLREEYETRYAQGDEKYRDYSIEIEFWYNHPLCESEDENEIWNNMCECNESWGPRLWTSSRQRKKGIERFEEMMCMQDNANALMFFGIPELKQSRLHFYMYDIFHNGEVYSFADAMQMKAENFSWQTRICIEHWGKRVKECGS